MSKRVFIKDPLWGNIELFSWESRLTNHFIVNRLTNIIQNSSAFRAYPGLKYSRFLHTIGVVHVVTQLFSNAVRNADPEVLDEFRKEADRASELFSEEQLKLICEELAGYTGQHAKFSALLAILRTCAFIHDLGHLPYSHVFENALETFMSEGIEKTITFPKEVLIKRKALQDAIHKAEKETNGHQESEKIHERIGIHLANALQHELEGENELNSKLASTLIQAACRLLHEHQFPIAITFIKGVVEADRIDFIRRDGAFSGLFVSGVDYDRLFMLYTLERIDDHTIKKIVALPSIRAASETEKLLWERFQDYKYIVMHHKVHLYDEIVENIIIHLIAEGKLTKFLDDLIKLLNYKVKGRSFAGMSANFALLKAVLLQFDDPWLESHIRNVYREIIESQFEREGTKTKKKSHDSDILFQVYVEERKRFTSVFKSDCDFWNAVTYTKQHVFESLRPEGPVLTKEEASYRKHFFNSIYAGKLALQKLMKDKLGGVTVIIGPTEKKVNFGVRDEDEARSYQVGELVNYLKHKKYGTMLFNLWFDSECNLTQAEFLEKTMPIIEKFASEAILQAKQKAKLQSTV